MRIIRVIRALSLAAAWYAHECPRLNLLAGKGTCMPKTSRPTSNKRAREKAQAERKKEKEQRRAEARERKANAPARSGDEDPDLAGMVPGPQPKPDWLEDIDEETENK